LLAVSLLAPAAVLLMLKTDVTPLADAADAPPARSAAASAPVVVDEAQVPCCVEVVAADQNLPAAAMTVGQAGANFSPAALVSASRYRIVDRTLPAGVAPERGLQIKTILTARSISAVFPEIHEIGGVRADALRWHPNGLALDVMVPNPSSSAGIELGNQIVSYVLKNADYFGIQDAIWRGVYYTPSGAQASGAGHYDHVHVTTTGGGYPDGDEVYFR
jgi:hypothetical protein